MDGKKMILSEQDKLLLIQQKCAKKSRSCDIVTLILTLGLIVVFTLLFWILPDKNFSEQENRVLQQLPKIQSNFSGSFMERLTEGKFLDRLVNGKYTAEIADYYADQFPARDFFVGLKGISEAAQLKGGNNGVVICEDGYIITREDYPDANTVSANLAAIEEFSAVMESDGVLVYLAMAGRPVDVLESSLPALYPYESSEVLWKRFRDESNRLESTRYIELLEPLKAAHEAGEQQIYYRTDHHWTTHGAYLAYREIMSAMGMEAYEIGDFEIEVVSDSFYGTTWSNGGMKWIGADEMVYYRFGDDMEYTTSVADTGISFDSFYDRSYLEKKDKYSSFISGNNARVDITKKTGEKREKLLLIKDSFAHSAAPFLARHFDLVIIDLRYFKESCAALVREEGIDRVLILNYIGSNTSSNVHSILKFGLEQES